jgi:hypothetical protein
MILPNGLRHDAFYLQRFEQLPSGIGLGVGQQVLT